MNGKTIEGNSTRYAGDTDEIIAYSAQARVGLTHSLGIGRLGIFGQFRYVSNIPQVNYVGAGTMTGVSGNGAAVTNYRPARIHHDDGRFAKVSVEYRIAW